MYNKFTVTFRASYTITYFLKMINDNVIYHHLNM